MVKIDNRSFPKLDGRRGLFDSEVAWNGNNLKGLSKINRFYIYLEKGEHELLFLADQSPILERADIFSLNKPLRFNLNGLKAKDGDRRQWITIILADLPLKHLEIVAKAQQGKYFLLFSRDDSDLKLIIDGEIQKNNEPKSHPHWYWCGNTLKGQSKTFSKELNLSRKLHYIELWADREVEIKKILLEFPESKIEFDISDIQTYIYKGINGNENYNRFDSEVLDAVNFWNRKFFTQKYPPPEPLHPNLVKAIIYIESRAGYFEAPQGYYPGYPDVIQISDPRNPAMKSMRGEEGYEANEFISEEEYGHMSYSYPEGRNLPSGDTPKDSIFWGVRWLYHKAQYLPQISQKPYSRGWRTWNQSVQNYNSEGNAEYKAEVYDVYERGLDKRSKKNTIKLWTFALIAILAIASAISWLSSMSEENKTAYTLQANIAKKQSYEEQFYKDLEDYKKGNLYYYGDVFSDTLEVCLAEGCVPEIIFYDYIDELLSFTENSEQFIEAALSLRLLLPNSWDHHDIDNDGKNEVIFLYPDLLNRDFLKVIIIDEHEGKFAAIERILSGESYFNSPDSIIVDPRPLLIRDVTGDLIPEILIFVNDGRDGANIYIFQYKEDGFLEEIFSEKRFLFPRYTFYDKDGNGRIDLVAVGDKKQSKQFLDVPYYIHYEYSPKTGGFVKIEERF